MTATTVHPPLYMANPSLLSLSLVLLLCSSCLGAGQRRQGRQQPLSQQGAFRLRNLNPLQPQQRMRHEAGITEIWDQNDEQLQCAGVATTRYVIERRGILLPSFNNALMLAFVLRGPKRPGGYGRLETYRSFRQQSERGQESQRVRDQR